MLKEYYPLAKSILQRPTKMDEIMKKILIIDDERAIRSTLKEILEFEKYNVDDAENGVEGLKMAMSNNYDLIFCDIKMPKMDGVEFLDEKIKTK